MIDKKDFFSAIVARFPAIVPHLKGHAAQLYCEIKALERDKREPARKQKIAIELSLKLAMVQRFERQLKLIKAQLEEQRKSINIAGINIPDDDAEYAAFVKIFYDALLSGSEEAAFALGISLGDGAINARALQVARTYATEWLRQLDVVSQDAVRQAIETFINVPGTTVGDTIDLLSRQFSQTRAERIAITETTRVFATANDLYAQELLITYPEFDVVRRWYTNNDDLVCPICGPLEGREVGVNEPFALGVESPPAHVNCRCWTAVTVKA